MADTKSSKCAECNADTGSCNVCANCTHAIAQQVLLHSQAPTGTGTCTFCNTDAVQIVASLKIVRGCIVCVAHLLVENKTRITHATQAPTVEQFSLSDEDSLDSLSNHDENVVHLSDNGSKTSSSDNNRYSRGVTRMLESSDDD